MIITELKTRLIGLGFRNTIVVELHTDEGLIGIGGTVMKRRSKTVEQNLHELDRYLVGQNPLQIEQHFEVLYRDSFWVGGPLHTTAISAVDSAMWDLLGKSLGVPVWQLLGGATRDSIPVYCHCPAGDSPETFAENLKACQTWGYKAAKTTLPLFYGQQSTTKDNKGYSGQAGQIPKSHRETERLPAVTFPRIAEFFAAGREAVGAEFDIGVDCHGRLSPAQAVQLCDALEPYNLMFIEEPVPPEDPIALREVASRSVTPIAAGERLSTVYGVRPFLDANALALLQIDVANCGGITAAKKIAALAESHYVGICPHNPNGPIETAMTVNVLASIPNCYMLEMIGSPQDLELHSQMVKKPLLPVNGEIALPTAPGLGMELKTDAEERFPYVAFTGSR